MAGLKKILFISYDGMTDPLGQSQVIPYLSGLTKFGYEFTILSCDKKEKFQENKDYVCRLLQDFPIKWVSLPYHKNPPVLSSMYDLYQLKRKVKELQLQQKFDMVHTRPGLPTLVALWMRKKYGTRFLNDVRGFWADERVDGGMWNIKNFLFKRVYNYFKRHETECLQKADYNSCLTHAAKKEILSWKNIPGQPLAIEVIPCSVDLELFNPDNINENLKEELRKELNIKPGDFIISYLGSVGGWYLTDEMMRFCKKLSDKIPAAKFLFISPHRHQQIINAAAKYSLAENRIITKTALRHQVPVLLSFSSYSLFFIKPCYSKISSSPTKHGEIMAMGIPVITNSGVGDVKQIVEKYHAGLVLDEFSEKTFDDITDKITNPSQFSKVTIRNGAVEFYSLKDAVGKYREIYDKILA
ncbi:MAG: glycosyltransferase [Ferruginibacter sp.]